jgi:hypothetical protein
MLNSPRFIGRALVLALLALTLGPLPAARATDAPPVVVELFTSQGCSSCPPADAYLGELAQRPDVLALSFHIDYWNYIGWPDPFATNFATARQHAYARQLNMRYVYTPQMVVNGTTEGVGSERTTIAGMINAAEQDKTRHPRVTLRRNADGSLAIHVDAGTAAAPVTVWLAGFDGEHTTRVLRGENAGATLKDYQVVRSWASLGVWQGAALDLTVPADKLGGDGGVAVLLQENGVGRIIGAAQLKPPTS